MDLLWFLLGIILIFGISRYLESNKLFWILLISFVGSYTLASITAKSILRKKEVSKSTVMVSPTQASTGTSDLYLLANDPAIDIQDFLSKLASKVYRINNSTFIASNNPSIRDGVVYKLLKPPRCFSFFDTS